MKVTHENKALASTTGPRLEITNSFQLSTILRPLLIIRFLPTRRSLQTHQILKLPPHNMQPSRQPNTLIGWLGCNIAKADFYPAKSSIFS